MAIVPNSPVTVPAAVITDIGQFPERSSFELAEEALSAALQQAGIAREEIDGIAWNLGAPLGENYDVMCNALDLSPRFVVQTWTHGRFTGTSLSVAAMAVSSGAASTVACVGGIKGIPAVEGEPTAPGESGFEMFTRPAADALNRYLEMYGADRDRLADVVLSARRYGALNPKAFLQGGFSLADYEASPVAVAPLRAADCFPTDAGGRPMNDAGVCVLISSDPKFAERPGQVRFVASQGIQGGREEVYFGRPGLGESPHPFTPTDRDLSVFNDTGIHQDEIDGFFTYDAFSSTVWYALERFGYCAPGDAPAFATQERMSVEGDLPVNTNGGMLSAGHTSGWAQIVEMVDQLKGEAGPRQISGARLLHWGTVFGDSVFLSNDQEVGGPRKDV